MIDSPHCHVCADTVLIVGEVVGGFVIIVIVVAVIYACIYYRYYTKFRLLLTS